MNNINLLYIDPEELMFTVIEQEAKVRGYKTVMCAKNVEEALVIFSNAAFDGKAVVFIGNYNLPSMSCVELVQKIKKIRDVPIIVCTFLCRDQIITHELFENGVARILDKPFSLRSIFQHIEELMDS